MENKHMNFMKNQAIINEIVAYAVFEGRINNFMLTMCKEVFLTGEYLEGYEHVLDEDNMISLIDSFEKIRKEKLFDKCTNEFHIEDMDEFEKLLELELQEEVISQLRELDKENSLEKVVDNFLTGVLVKLPSEKNITKMMKEIPKLINGIDKEKLGDMKEIAKGFGKK